MSDYIPTTELVRNKSIWLSEKQFDSWLAEVIREAKEEAWDEGFHEGMYDEWSHGNPYRDIS